MCSNKISYIVGRQNSKRYCKQCKRRMNNMRMRIYQNKLYNRKKKIWESKSPEEQLKLMNKLSKKLLK